MAMRLGWILITCVFQQEAPYKNPAEFDVTIDYSLRARPVENEPVYDSRYKAAPASSERLPYLRLKVLLKYVAPDEPRVRVVNSLGKTVLTRKVQSGDVIAVDVGFTEDVKSRIEPHRFELWLGARLPVSRIVLEIAEDGTFTINEVVRGKF